MTTTIDIYKKKKNTETCETPAVIDYVSDIDDPTKTLYDRPEIVLFF